MFVRENEFVYQFGVGRRQVEMCVDLYEEHYLY